MDLVDAPTNDATLLAYYSAAATALALWEPRFELTDIAFDAAGADGRVQLDLQGLYFPDGHKGDRTPDAGLARTLAFTRTDSRWRQIL